MSWLTDKHSCDIRSTGEHLIDNQWLVSANWIQRISEEVQIWGVASSVTRVLIDVPGLAQLILDILDRAAELGHRKRARLSLIDEKPSQLLLEIPSTPEEASRFLEEIDEWIITKKSVDIHRRLIVDVCFIA